MAAEASRASDIARICDDNKVEGVVRDKKGKRPLRPSPSDQISLVKQIDKLKAEFVEKKEIEPDDPLVQSPALAYFSPFSKPEPGGPARGKSQQWQREHLRPEDPLQREMEQLFEEPSSPHPRESSLPQKPLSRSQSSQQQPQQSRPSRYRSQSQPSGSQPSGSQPSGSQPSGSQPYGSQPSRSQPQQSQQQQLYQQQQLLQQQLLFQQQQLLYQQQQLHQQQQQQPMQYKPAPQQHHGQRQWTQGLENVAAQSLAYVPEVPREEAAPADTAMLELEELREGSYTGNYDYGLRDRPIDTESEKKKTFCHIGPHCIIDPFPG
ncbi:hypothetical protein GGI43DRAFT_210297 [Trichoderma evansii]